MNGGLVLLATLILAGCAADGRALERPATAASATPEVPRQDPSAMADVLSVRTAADYIRADSPAELGERADLIVRGRIERVSRRGGIRFPEDPDVPFPLAVMEVRVETVLKGSVPSETAGRALVAFFGGSPSALAAATPDRAETLLYLSRGLQDPEKVYPGGTFTPAPDYADAGKPVFEVPPQGLMVADPGDVPETIALSASTEIA